MYKIAEVNNTIIEFYEKEMARREESLIYIMARQNDGKERLISTLSYKADLNSLLNIIAKHKARKFAESMQF